MPFRSGIRIEAGRQAVRLLESSTWNGRATPAAGNGMDATPHHILITLWPDGRADGGTYAAGRPARRLCVCAHECALKRYSFYDGAALDRQRERALIPLLMAPLIGRLRWRSRFISNSDSQLCPRIGTREDAVCTMRRRRSQQERNPGY